jgi:hypothetical protein
MKATFLIVGLLILPASATPRTWYILPDGTGDAPTIQAGVDSCVPFDTVLVGPGTYYETVKVFERKITIVGEAGPGQTVIDAQQNGRPLTFSITGGSLGWLSGFTLTGGDANADSFGTGLGGGLDLAMGKVLVSECIIQGNLAREGGGVYVFAYKPNYVLSGCLISDNIATEAGGGVFMMTSWEEGLELENNTIVGNAAPLGAGVYYVAAQFALLTLTNNIIAGNNGDYGVYGHVSNDISATCNNVWGHMPSDYGGSASDHTGTDGNISLDPLFCDLVGGDYRLDCSSPCLPGNHPDGADCGLIGKYAVGCGPSAIEKTTWGRLKAMYRQ